MICPNCGTDNPNSSHFCGSCGEAIYLVSESAAGKKCSECGFENGTGARFCVKCGAALAGGAGQMRQRHPRHSTGASKKSKRERPIRKHRLWYESPAPLISIALAVVVGVVLYGARGHRKVETAATAPPGVILDPALRPSFDKVVDRFICGCGECTEPLWKCNCPTAETEKKMVRNDLERGEESPQVINAVYKTYGHLASGPEGETSSGAGSSYVPGSLSLPK